LFAEGAPGNTCVDTLLSKTSAYRPTNKTSLPLFLTQIGQNRKKRLHFPSINEQKYIDLIKIWNAVVSTLPLRKPGQSQGRVFYIPEAPALRKERADRYIPLLRRIKFFETIRREAKPLLLQKFLKIQKSFWKRRDWNATPQTLNQWNFIKSFYYFKSGRCYPRDCFASLAMTYG